ncbi:chromatin-remodeling complex subunit ies6 [Zalaria obscura]|uniref:Chromatin-remodeling complex subunit ies6 n=1 Tax=Zalaria obscura TaxID=2024903 RepID=A0ACC3S2X9_9PEZI
MAPITTQSDESNHMALLDKLDMNKIHKPFRNPNWKPPQRRNKTVKQIIAEAQRKEASMLNTQNNSGATTPQPAGSGAHGSLNPNATQENQDLSRLVVEKNLRAANGPAVTYTGIAAAPSLKPKQRYCDITGLPAKYTDPKTGLRYCNKEVYAIIKTLGTGQVQEYLAARGANTVLK